MAKHYVIFIHGMGERPPLQDSQDITSNSASQVGKDDSYDQLWEATLRELDRYYNPQIKPSARLDYETLKQKLSHQVELVPIYWHTEEIYEAEAAIFNRAFPTLQSTWVDRYLPFLRPMRNLICRPARNFMTFFIGDVAAYVSADVNVVRRTVWQQLWARLQVLAMEEDATYSLVAHSLGSVIAFDFLYELFKLESLRSPGRDALFVPQQTGNHQTNINTNIHVTREEIRILQNRFRHLITLGSPIGLFMLRKGELWDQGALFKHIYNPVRGVGRNWLNFYDPNDVFAYPLKDIFGLNRGHTPEHSQDPIAAMDACLLRHLPACPVQDIPVRAGFTPFGAHTGYWGKQKIAEAIAQTLYRTPSRMPDVAACLNQEETLTLAR
jgi:hypothetical protein